MFLNKLAEVLKLEGVHIINDRAENFSSDENYRGEFDFVTLKAFGDLKAGVKVALPFLRSEGYMVVYKGKKVMDQIKGTRLPGECKIEDIDIPEINLSRCIVTLKKIKD